MKTIDEVCMKKICQKSISDKISFGTTIDIENEENWRSLKRKIILKVNVTQKFHLEHGTLKTKKTDEVCAEKDTLKWKKKMTELAKKKIYIC